jgi:hypothetical protein
LNAPGSFDQLAHLTGDSMLAYADRGYESLSVQTLTEQNPRREKTVHLKWEEH